MTGPDRGTCENCDNNPICECNEVKGWTLNKKIGDCSCNENLCQAPNSTLVCNGGGVCDCNECVCGSFVSEFCIISLFVGLRAVQVYSQKMKVTMSPITKTVICSSALYYNSLYVAASIGL